MKNTLLLTTIRMRLAMRTRVFLFFSLIMPIAFLFLYAGIFAKGDPEQAGYLLPSVMAITVMGSFWGMSVQLVLFREQGILRRFRLAPVGAFPMLASGILANYILTIPTIFIELFLARWVFKVGSFGNVLGVLVLVSLGAMTFAAMGLIVASVTNSMQETQVICNVIWFALLFLSGATVPLPSLPGFIQKIALYLPPTYLITSVQKMLLGNQSLLSQGGAIVSLVGSLLVSLFASVQMFRWEQEEKILGKAKLKALGALLPFLLIGTYELFFGHQLADARELMRQSQAREQKQQQMQQPQAPPEPEQK